MRHAELNDLLPFLQGQHDSKYDVVVPSTHLAYRDGIVVVADGTVTVDEDGVGTEDAVLVPTSEFEGQLAERLDIPARYLRRLREADPLNAGVPDEFGTTAAGLLDDNVNFWLSRSERNWLVRGFKAVEYGGATRGVARAFLSDRYQMVDHIDAVTATLDGIVAAGVAPPSLEVSGDLSATRLRVRVVAPEVTARADGFLHGYRNPTGDDGPPVVAAGLVLTNSETGHGAFSIAPQITIMVCRNGMTRTVDAMRRIHLGSQMESGVVDWSVDTRKANIDLIRSQAKDAVAAFLSADYLERVAAELDEKGSVMLDRPHEVVEGIGKRLGYTEEERASILDLFTRGGDVRAGGVVNAFTAYARDVDDPERAMTIEEEAFTILELASA